MKKVYIAKPGQRLPIPTREEVLCTLWKQGLLSEDLLYWQTDLKCWVPLAERFRRDNFSLATNRFYLSRLPTNPVSGDLLPRRRPERRFSCLEAGRHPRPPLHGRPGACVKTIPKVDTNALSPEAKPWLALGHGLLTVVLAVAVLGMLAGVVTR